MRVAPIRVPPVRLIHQQVRPRNRHLSLSTRRRHELLSIITWIIIVLAAAIVFFFGFDAPGVPR